MGQHTVDSVLAERRRALAHLGLGMESHAYDVAIAAVRSGASVESIVPEYVRIAGATGRIEALEEELARCGISLAAMMAGPSVTEPRRDPVDPPAPPARPQPTGDLGDQVAAGLRAKGWIVTP